MCHHTFCEACVIRLHSNQEAVTCCVCQTPLRRGDYVQLSAKDRTLDKEIQIRKQVLRDMNKRREDFHTLEDYNDYLEEVEEIIYNLVFRINVSETVKRWEQFKAENHALIAKNQQLQADEDRKIKEKIKREEVDLRKKREENARIESEERRLKLQLREEQLKQLSKGKSFEEAQKIAAKRRKLKPRSPVAAATPATVSAVHENVPVTDHQEMPLKYRPSVRAFEPQQPVALSEFKGMTSEGYQQKMIRPDAHLAAGYTESIPLKRATEEALSALFCF